MLEICLAKTSQLLKTNPKDGRVVALHATCLGQVGIFKTFVQVDYKPKELHEAIDLCDQHLKREPANPEVLTAINDLISTSALIQSPSFPAVKEELATKQVARTQLALESKLTDRALQQANLDALITLARFQTVKNPEAAFNSYLRAVPIAKKIYQNPSTLAAVIAKRQFFNDAAILATERRQYKHALELHQVELVASQEYQKFNSDESINKNWLLVAHQNLAGTHQKLGNEKEVLLHLEKELALHRTIIEANKDQPWVSIPQKAFCERGLVIAEYLEDKREWHQTQQLLAEVIEVRKQLIAATSNSDRRAHRVELLNALMPYSRIRLKLNIHDVDPAFEALCLLEELSTGSTDRETLKTIARRNCWVGIWYFEAGKPRQAEPCFTKSLTVYEKLHQQDDSEVDVQSGLIKVYNAIANLRYSEGNYNRSLEFYQRALFKSQSIKRDHDADSFRDQLEAASGLATVLWQLKKYREAASAFDYSYTMILAGAKRFPSEREVQCDILRVLVDLRKFLDVYEDFDQLESILMMIERQTSIVQNPEWKDYLLKRTSQQRLEEMLRQNKVLLEKCSKAKSTMGHLENILKLADADRDQRLATQVKMLLHRKKVNEASDSIRQTADWLQMQGKSSGRSHYVIAGLYARCASVDTANREQFIERAVQYLKLAKADGYFTIQQMFDDRKDVSFAEVRQHPEIASFFKHAYAR